jgi:hypothetical protein
LKKGACPSGCREGRGFRYDKQHFCLAEPTGILACIQNDPNVINDPRCAKKVSTGDEYQVPYYLAPPSGLLSSTDWGPCADSDEGIVSSGVTPFCTESDAGSEMDAGR